MKTTAVWCLHTCGPQRYFEILWKVNFVDDFIHSFIPLWHGDITYAETVPSWFPLKLKWPNLRKTEYSDKNNEKQENDARHFTLHDVC